MPQHFRHHVRFYAAGIVAVACWLATPMLPPPTRMVVAGDVFFATYLISVARLVRQLDVERLREHAKYEDEGIAVIILLTIALISLSLGSVVMMLADKSNVGAVEIVLAVTSIALGWLTLHTIMALRYAHRFYSRKMPGGIRFPDTDEPGIWDFLYHSFVVGMTAQVADNDVTSTRMRRTIMSHSVIAFFYNTIILALAVNVAAGLAS